MGRLARFIRFFTDEDDGEPVPPPVWDSVTGNPVSFNAITPFPLKQLSVAFSPVQDLNGYDSPWPAGGGKNILPITEWFESGYTQTINGVTMTVNADGSLTFSGTPTSQAEFQLSSKAATPPFNLLTVEAGTYTISQSGIPTGVKFITSGGGGNGFPYTELTSTNTSATGAVTDGTVPFNYFIIRIPADTSSNGTYKLQLETGSTPSTWTPYSNLCPILGWDSLNVEQRGKNLLNPVAKTNGFYAPSVGSALPDLTRDYSSFADNALTVNGTAWNGNGFISDRVFAGKTYKVTGALTATTPRCSVVTLDEEYKVVRNIRNIIASGEWNESITIADGEMYIGFSLVNAADSPITLANPSVSESGEYQPYNGRTISISLGSTVYSGTVDVCTGVGEIDKVLIALTGTERYQYRNAEAGIIQAFWKTVDNIHPTIVTTAPVISNMFASSTSWDAAEGTMSVKNSGTDSYFNFRNTAVFPANNIDGVKAKVAELYAAGTPVSAVATLATPIPIQLTPQEVESLAGDNTMWTDADSLTVEYRSN